MSKRLRLDRLLGCGVAAKNSRPIGRIEECRFEQRGGDWLVSAFVIGQAGLLERLGLSARRLMAPRSARGVLVRWDQIDLSDADRPRLRCAVDELERIEP